MTTYKLNSLVFLIFFSFFLFPHQSYSNEEETSDDINWWCSKTPHPELCKYFMADAGLQRTFKPTCKAEFRTMTAQVALEQVLLVQNHSKKMGPHCRGKRKKLVWMDCDKLIDNTIFQLNRTLHGIGSNSTSCTDFDAQTWLSASLTNIETCLSGSNQLNVSNILHPTLSTNVSQLLSNSLAVNGELVDSQNSTEIGGFPSWVTTRERKLIQSSTSSLAAKAIYVVAQDGSGNFRTIQAAINAAAEKVSDQRTIIYIKKGVYRENVAIGPSMSNIMLVGAGLRYTIITGSRSAAAGFTTYSTATVGVDGSGFIARGITFRNTAGPKKGQAVALRSASDLSVFYACGFEGYQDTIFVQSQRQFYKTCQIYGTIDFIFGNAAVVFQNCVIYVRRPLVGQVNVITAQGRGDPFQNTGISIHNSRITAAPSLAPVVRAFKTYLGRPWQEFSRTIILRSYIDSVIHPSGWLPWQDSDFAFKTLYFGEYGNFGPGSSTRYRVKWPGYHVITDAKEASKFTVANLVGGRTWLPSTGVPFTSGL
ncbi:probable pectinesterase/pectinesterase inhibitor 33 [Lycium barbarum]|uniref:probable pectinesterase/pectinesterase inhibitor 33 n=1 Tax=Lycium barbarum TaxID=112863 RepID=UPI00293F18B0|nr:probable pectinesterase/pectinesterase inhibitor 33 [Lycium barbarum]